MKGTPGPVPESLLRAVERSRRARPTPKTTIEAVLYCVQALGLGALDEPANVARLSTFDAAAFDELNARMSRMKDLAHA